MSTFYMKSDGNGGMLIGKGTMALILFLITVFSTFAAVVTYSVTVKSEVDQHEKSITNLEGKLEIHEKDTSNVGKDIATLTTKVDQTQKDIDEIKKDIKSLISKGG